MSFYLGSVFLGVLSRGAVFKYILHASIFTIHYYLPKSCKLLEKLVKKKAQRHFPDVVRTIMANSHYIPIDEQDTFRALAYKLPEALNITEFKDIVRDIRRQFPNTSTWLDWWMRPTTGSMIFPALSSMSEDLANKIPSTSNAVEGLQAHMYLNIGVGHSLLDGITELYRYATSLQTQHANYNGMSVFNGGYCKLFEASVRPLTIDSHCIISWI